MSGLRRLFFLMIVLVCFPVMTGTSHAQSVNQEYIGDPAFLVSGEFLAYYNSAEDPLEIFGYPITVEFTDPITNTRVQYFQKARFDLELTQNGTVVTSAPLGELLYESGKYAQADLNADNAVCHTFTNSNKVCFAFWQFYQTQNGEEFLGLPVSNTEINEAGYLVQYFENAVLEWHPEKAPGYRVVVADFGKIYFDEFVGDPRYTKSDPSAIIGLVRTPQVNVFVERAIVAPNSQQELFVVVYDQYQQPMPGALVTITITLPNGNQNFFRLPETNQYGISTLELMVGDLAPKDVVYIEAQVTNGGDAVKASTWFRVWW